MSSRACITFTAAQRSSLECISRETGAPFAELVRRAVDSFVAARDAGRDRDPAHPAREPDAPGPSPSIISH